MDKKWTSNKEKLKKELKHSLNLGLDVLKKWSEFHTSISSIPFKTEYFLADDKNDTSTKMLEHSQNVDKCLQRTILYLNKKYNEIDSLKRKDIKDI